MKKVLLILLLTLFLAGTLSACLEAPTPGNTAPLVETETPDPEEAPEPDPEEETTNGAADTSPQAGTYTVQQIQAAIQPQFQVGDWGEGNPQVISAERAARDRDYFLPDTGGPQVDLTNAVRYRVEIRFRQSFEDYSAWAESFLDSASNPFRRDGDYTILTDYFYFNDVNGEPEIAFVLC